MKKLAAVFGCVALVSMFLSGCHTGKTTTTVRGTVEMALIAESTDRAIAGLAPIDTLPRKAFFDDSLFAATDKEYVISSLKLDLLTKGVALLPKADDADVVVHPRAAISAIDDSSFLIGIPSIPLPIPGAGVLGTPELAIFKRAKQIGRAKLGTYGVDAKTNKLVFDTGLNSAKAYYTRWVLFQFITWRTTDIEDPYKN